MLVSVLEEHKKILLTSIPRDLYVGGAKINAHFCHEGFDAFKQRVGKITGYEPTHYITADFDSMVWAVNRMGGAKPNIERSFTDYNYPQDRPAATYPPNFQAGKQHLDGEEALQFCRSRKGSNGEGSDFRRMARQQTLLLSMPQAFETSDLPEMTLQALYRLFTGHLGTNLKIGETGELLSLLTQWRSFEVEQLVLNTQNFLYHPPNSQYGGAYVLRPLGDSYSAIQSQVKSLLGT